MRDAPLVAIIIASFGRPDALRLTLESVRAQTLGDWQVLVVGDCSPGSRAVVDSFGEPRFGFVDLAINYGEQSGPNNVGLARTQSRYVAWLNHDDLWFPDFLAVAVDWLEATAADLVFGAAAVVRPATRAELEAGRWSAWLGGESPTGGLDPAVTHALASSWLLRRSLAERLGGWRAATRTARYPSADFLERANRAGASLRALPHLGTVICASGLRKGSYVEPQDLEQAWFWERMRAAPAFRAVVLDHVAPLRPQTPLQHLTHAYLRLLGRPMMALGLSPLGVLNTLRGRPGRWVLDTLRRTRGLGPLPRNATTMAALRRRHGPPDEG
ncbi:glycosyltransferase family 2 protein [Zavarzinia sp. CC-PAN008]|uniref:glycosyltransferase family 2 protein n=1 Tax=Zavarzinia sp. CC-PAN008 TaxID=3243332 RepID=UPI003F747B84